MTRFDWYQATVYASDPEQCGLLSALSSAWDLSDIGPEKPMHGFTSGARISRGDHKLCHLWWGGNPGINITATSADAPVLADVLSRSGLPFGVTRADACMDWLDATAFDSLAGHLIEFAKANRIVINQQGDWARGVARTLYVGSPQSPVRICLYEKGYEQGGDAPRDWTRLEVRVKPKGPARISVGRMAAADLFGCGWVHEALQPLGLEDLQKRAVGVVWRPSDTERARRALLKQYGAVMAQWADEAGGWDTFGKVIQEALETA